MFNKGTVLMHTQKWYPSIVFRRILDFYSQGFDLVYYTSLTLMEKTNILAENVYKISEDLVEASTLIGPA